MFVSILYICVIFVCVLVVYGTYIVIILISYDYFVYDLDVVLYPYDVINRTLLYLILYCSYYVFVRFVFVV